VLPHGHLLAGTPVRGLIQRLPVQHNIGTVARRHLATAMPDDYPQR
jgi:hypothetical protein